jgi:hypothetical protein
VAPGNVGVEGPADDLGVKGQDGPDEALVVDPDGNLAHVRGLVVRVGECGDLELWQRARLVRPVDRKGIDVKEGLDRVEAVPRHGERGLGAVAVHERRGLPGVDERMDLLKERRRMRRRVHLGCKSNRVEMSVPSTRRPGRTDQICSGGDEPRWTE